MVRIEGGTPIQILVPLAGMSPFFKSEDYPFPKPLIEVGGTPMIELVVDNLKSIAPQNHRFLFAIRHPDVAHFSLDRTLRLVAGPCDIVSLQNLTQGALCTALMTIDHINRAAPLVICNGDQVIEADLRTIFQSFFVSGVDAGVITFPSVHPRWSYVSVGTDGFVREAAEKRVISRNAVAGFYFFRRGELFLESAMKCIASGNSVDGQYYIAPALNELILQGGRIASHSLAKGQYHSFYSPQKIQEYEEARLIRRIEQPKGREPKMQVVIPAAGEGSRFHQAGYTHPKPFIDVLGRPMIEHVIHNTAPTGSRVHVLFRTEHMKLEVETVQRLRDRGHHLHGVDALTQGTACTVLLARPHFDGPSPLLIANSDQLVDFSVDAFVGDCLERGLDGSIVVFRDPTRNPKWSFARIDERGLVAEVAEKLPISDIATSGIYFFARGSDFVNAAIDMIVRNDRTNDEFYTCPVYNYMIANGLRIGVFEVAQTAMHGLGTPSDLEGYIARRLAEVS